MHREGFGGGRGFGGRDFRGGGGGRDFDQKVAPVKVGEEVDVAIEAVGAKGDGIAKKDGFVIFVPNTSTGDNVRIRIIKVLNNMAFAEVAGQGGQGGVSSEPRKERQEEAEAGGKGGEEVESAGDAGSDTVEQHVDTEDFGEEGQ